MSNRVDMTVLERITTISNALAAHMRRPHPTSSETPQAGYAPRGRANGTIDPLWIGEAATTGFPPSPRVNQRHWHGERGLEYYWDGARWLSMQEGAHTFGFPRVLQPLTASGISGQSPIDQRYRQRWQYLSVRTFISGAIQDAVNHWQIQVMRTGTNGATPLVEFNTSTDPANQSIIRVTAKDPANTGAMVISTPLPLESAWGDHMVYVNAVANGTAGTLSIIVDLKYRYLD